MADGSSIEWTEATWNPTVGCTKVSPGCDNCYAEKDVNRRHAAALSPKTSPRMLEAFPTTFVQVSVRPDRFLHLPLTWREPRKIFVNSLSDLFHADVPDEFIAEVFAVMAAAPRHTFQLLTKRHSRMRSLVSRPAFAQRVGELAAAYDTDLLRDDPLEPGDSRMRQVEWPLPNVWLGVSVEDQHWADIRIPALLDTLAAVRWISAEPLLGPLCICEYLGTSRRPRLDWVVTGGESGPGARPMHPRWALDVAHDCADHGVAFLHKQNGAFIPDRDGGWTAVDTDGREYPGRLRRVGKAAAGRELDGRTHDGYPTTAVHV